MILPCPCASIRRPAYWLRNHTAFKFVSITVFQNSSECSAAGARRMVPALFTRMSIEPNSFTVSSTSILRIASSHTSPDRVM